jgi:hypothetical protein
VAAGRSPPLGVEHRLQLAVGNVFVKIALRCLRGKADAAAEKESQQKCCRSWPAANDGGDHTGAEGFLDVSEITLDGYPRLRKVSNEGSLVTDFVRIEWDLEARENRMLKRIRKLLPLHSVTGDFVHHQPQLIIFTHLSYVVQANIP